MYQGFYWPRIWLTLDKDLQEEIDSRQAMADSAIYTVFALYVSGVLCILYSILHLLEVTRLGYLPLAPYYWLFPLLNFAVGYFIYRQTLHVHAQFGETFKAVFDRNGHKVMFPEILQVIAGLTDSSLSRASVEEQNMAVWRYLHNYRIKCPSCGEVIGVNELAEHKCPNKKLEAPSAVSASLPLAGEAQAATAVIEADSDRGQANESLPISNRDQETESKPVLNHL
jgi:hypothetical protein